VRKAFAGCLAISLTIILIPAEAASYAVGQKCGKLNQRASIPGKKLICTKVKGKLIWSEVPSPIKSTAPTPTPSNSPTPISSPTPIATATPATWKQLTADEVIAQSSKAIGDYLAVKRTPNQEVIVLLQPGIDPLWKDFIYKGATLVAQAFTYPALGKPFYDVVAIDKDWLATTYKEAGFSDRDVQDRLGGFAAGAPAFGGSTTNTWNMTTLKNNNSLVNDKAGTYQTPGHEFFHGIQERYAGRNPGPKGEEIPNWFWEGPAMFVGIHSASVAGYIDFKSEGRTSMLNRFKNSPVASRVMPLIDVKANDRATDPYAIGFAATEYLVAQVGVEKFLKIYAELGTGKSFSQAFEAATGLKLSEFYSHFEEARSGLGFPAA
jgi:hypothetical protein